MGTVGILNVGAGDTKLSFDKSNPAECIRAARIVKDMLQGGYALLVEVKRGKTKAFERALDFREDTCEYIIADLDPVVAEEHDAWQDATRIQNQQEIKRKEVERGKSSQAPPKAARRAGKGNGRRRAVPASGTRAVAVARSAGG